MPDYAGLATVAGYGYMSATDKQKERLFIDLMADYGAKFDHRVVFDGACAVGSPGIITSATIAFTAADVGKRIVLTGAGASGAQYVGSISSLNSGTSVNVSPNIATTVSAKGLQVHTDDLTAWTNAITDINNSIFPGAIIRMQTPNGATPFGVSGFTGRSGISSFLPTINKRIHIEGLGCAGTSDTGDYTKAGGTCIAYVGTSNAPTAFGAVLTIAPVAGATNQHLNGVNLKDFWIDCRNGDQNEALKGILLQSSFGHLIQNVFVMDPCAYGMEMGVISPGTPGALGEAKDCSRGMVQNFRVRALDAPASAPAAFTTTTTALALTTSGQSFTLAGALANQPTAGYVWMMTTAGYPVLVNYTGGGGTTTLTGCTVSLQDSQGTPTTVSGSNVVQAHPGNASGLLLDGDATANSNFIHFDTVVVSQGTTWGPAALDLRNSDSNEFSNICVNGGLATVINATNRVTKPGVRISGSITALVNALSARNNVFKNCSAGVGGCSQMGVNNAGALLTTQAGPTYWLDYQLGNGEPIPTVEGNTFFQWSPNGGVGLPLAPAPTAVVSQTLTAATLTLLTGSLIAIPPQGFQVGQVFRWTVRATKSAAGAAIPGTFFVMINTTGTTGGGGTVATMATTSVGTAVADTGTFIVDMTVRSLGGAASGVAHLFATHGLQTTGWMAVQMQEIDATMATWNSATAQQFILLAMTSGATVVPTITQCYAEVVKPANP